MSKKNALSLAIINCKIWTPKSYIFSNHRFISPNGNCVLDQIDAVGVRSDKISVLDTRQRVLDQCDSKTFVIDAKGGLLVPGFTDSHCHFLDGGLRLLSVKLRDVNSREMFTRRVADACQKESPGRWILGGDWDHYSFGGTLPTKDWLDLVSPNNPVSKVLA
jgi:predicted amidohydrolase YtcJ